MNAPSPAMSHFVCDLMTLGHGELAAATADVYEHASGAETCAPRACSMRRIGDGGKATRAQISANDVLTAILEREYGEHCQ